MDPYLAVLCGIVLVGCGYLLGVTGGFKHGITFTLEKLDEQGIIDLENISFKDD